MTVGVLIAMCAQGATRDEAVASLAAKISGHLVGNERAQVTVRNASTLPQGSFAALEGACQKALRRRLKNPVPVEVIITVSENVEGFLLVAEIAKNAQKEVEMTSFLRENTSSANSEPLIEKHLVWRQPGVLLDLAIQGETMLALEPGRVVRYQRIAGSWTQAAEAPVPALKLRDPRGRLAWDVDQVSVYLPGASCHGPAGTLALNCNPNTEDFSHNGATVHFVPARNELAGERRWNGAGEAVQCGGRWLASAETSPSEYDSVALFSANGKRVSESLELPGPVTALWPAPEGALAVVRLLTGDLYAAYALTTDCRR